MIKVGIIGAETADAGELIRILIGHPEVEIKTLFSEGYAGRKVASIHHGFIGEEIVNFSEKIDPSSLDIVFVADNSAYGSRLINGSEEWPELRIVDMSPGRFLNHESSGFEYGLSEINRKALVRGARLATLPSAAASVALVSLYPLASHLLLGDDMEMSVYADKLFADSTDKAAVVNEIASVLSRTQTSFDRKPRLDIIPSDTGRAIVVKTRMRCTLSYEEIGNIYNSVYDDHHFVFTSLQRVPVREVEGTHKCVVSFNKADSDILEIEAVADRHLRGGAGDAVHVLNLLFALDEKVGLRLKPSRFENDETDGDKKLTWFA